MRIVTVERIRGHGFRKCLIRNGRGWRIWRRRMLFMIRCGRRIVLCDGIYDGSGMLHGERCRAGQRSEGGWSYNPGIGARVWNLGRNCFRYTPFNWSCWYPVIVSPDRLDMDDILSPYPCPCLYLVLL